MCYNALAMAFTYNFNNLKKDKVSSRCLFACHLLCGIPSVFISTFFTAYIFSFSSDIFNYVFNVALYNIIVYVTFFVFYYLFSLVVDRTDRVWFYRLGIVLRLAVVIIMIFFGRALSKMLYVAGVAYGLSESCYYASYNVLKQEMVSRNSMNKFATYLMAATKFIEIITPITLGALIDVSTYSQVALYVSVVAASAVLVSFFVRAKKPEGSNFSLKNYFAKIKMQPQLAQKMKFMYILSFVYGCNTCVTALLNISIMFEFNSNLSLGWLTSLISFVAMIEILLVNKFTKPGKRTYMYVVVAILPVVASVCFVSYPCVATVIVFNILMGISSIIYKTFFDVFRNGDVKEAGLYSEIAEHQTMVEWSITVARILTFGIMLGVSFMKNKIVYKAFLVVASLFYTSVLVGLLFFEKRYYPQGKKKQLQNQIEAASIGEIEN